MNELLFKKNVLHGLFDRIKNEEEMGSTGLGLYGLKISGSEGEETVGGIKSIPVYSYLISLIRTGFKDNNRLLSQTLQSGTSKLLEEITLVLPLNGPEILKLLEGIDNGKEIDKIELRRIIPEESQKSPIGSADSLISFQYCYLLSYFVMDGLILVTINAKKITNTIIAPNGKVEVPGWI